MIRARTITKALHVPTPQDFLSLLTWEHNRISQQSMRREPLETAAADNPEEATPAPKLHLDSVGQAGLTIAGLINLKGNLS